MKTIFDNLIPKPKKKDIEFNINTITKGIEFSINTILSKTHDEIISNIFPIGHIINYTKLKLNTKLNAKLNGGFSKIKNKSRKYTKKQKYTQKIKHFRKTKK